MGLVIGTALALVATRATASMLYGLKPHDAATFAAAAALLAAVTGAAFISLPVVRSASTP